MEHRVNALTSTRAFAALLVVIFHYGTDISPFKYSEQFFTGGNIAVSYFFVLSGFVMYLAYHNRHISYADFLRRRIARIMPLYVFAIILAVMPPLYHYWKYHTALGGHFAEAILLNLSFLQAYVPGYALTINSPGWSLSVEMFFYLLFPLLLLFTKARIKLFAVFAVLLYITSQIVHFLMIRHYGPFPAPEAHDLIYYDPLFHLNEFVLGMAGSYFLTVSNKKNFRFAPLVLLIAIVLLIRYVPRDISLHNGLLSPVFLLFILSLMVSPPRILNAGVLVFTGEISYGIYLLQEPVHFYAMKLNEHFMHFWGTGFFYFYLLLLFIIAAMSYRFIERPLRDRINGIRAAKK